MKGKTGAAGMSCDPFAKKGEGAFTLIEMILVVAVIGIMTSLVIAAITNSTADARRVIARQQQATIQESLNAWIARQKDIQTAMNTFTGAMTVSNKIELIRNYLDTSARWYTEREFTGPDGAMVTPNMESIGAYLSFSTWSSTNNPVVLLHEP